MNDTWFTADDLRTAAGAKQPIDQAKFDLAAKVACREVRRLCGPAVTETVIQRILMVRPMRRVSLMYRPASLVSIVTYPAGTALTVADYDFDGLSLYRKDGGPLGSVTVTYTSGYAADAIPPELMSMATLIGHQYLMVDRRFVLRDQTATGPTGFVVPDAAKEIGADYLLTRLGGIA